MTPFEYVFGLISIITSLAVTHLIVGIVSLVRHAQVHFSWQHAVWIWVAFAVVIGNWASFWNLRDDADFGVGQISMSLAFMASLYAFAALVIPELHRGSPVDLREFHEREGPRYIGAHMVFSMVALVQIAINAADFGQWIGWSKFALAAAVLSLLAILVRRPTVQAVVSLTMLPISAYYYLLMTHVR